MMVSEYLFLQNKKNDKKCEKLTTYQGPCGNSVEWLRKPARRVLPFEAPGIEPTSLGFVVYQLTPTAHPIAPFDRSQVGTIKEAVGRGYVRVGYKGVPVFEGVKEGDGRLLLLTRITSLLVTPLQKHPIPSRLPGYYYVLQVQLIRIPQLGNQHFIPHFLQEKDTGPIRPKEGNPTEGR